MSILDGMMFGLGRDVLLPLAVFFALLVLIAAIALFRTLVSGVLRWWCRVRGVPCGATHSRYPTCTLSRGHVGSHAGPWVDNNASRARVRWSVLTHGEVSEVEVSPTTGAADAK